MSPKVWPVQATQLDTSTARKYGELQRPMTSATEYPTGEDSAAYQRKIEIMAEIVHAANDFNPEQDFLLLVGDPILIGLTVAAIREYVMSEGWEDISILRYDKKLGRYLEIVVQL